MPDMRGKTVIVPFGRVHPTTSRLGADQWTAILETSLVLALAQASGLCVTRNSHWT